MFTSSGKYFLLSSPGDAFCTRQGSGTHLMKPVRVGTRERSLCSKEKLSPQVCQGGVASPEYKRKNAKKNRPKRQCATRQEVIQ
jgi:hypothetical protein